MFSLYTKEEYLRARRRQERIADRISIDSAGKKTIRSFLLREERLQAYELTHDFKEEEFVTVQIDSVLLFQLSVLARRARLTFYEYIEKQLADVVNSSNDDDADQRVENTEK